MVRVLGSRVTNCKRATIFITHSSPLRLKGSMPFPVSAPVIERQTPKESFFEVMRRRPDHDAVYCARDYSDEWHHTDADGVYHCSP